MTEQDKVTVDDIIGIVKTEEQTNSVEEVRKLRGRETITEKRFNILKNELDFYFDVNDTEKRWEIGDVELDNLPVFEDLVDLLNELVDENEQLKAQLSDCEKRVTDKEVEWLRNNTVWEQMPSSKRTFTTTSVNEDYMMTAKRFTKYVPDSYNYTSIITIVDHETNKRSGSIDDFVDMMNALHEENEQLKTTIQQLRTDNTKQKKKLNTAMKENEQLKCGNKNLKATLNDFINILNRLQSNPNDKQTVSVARDMLQNMGVDLE